MEFLALTLAGAKGFALVAICVAAVFAILWVVERDRRKTAEAIVRHIEPAMSSHKARKRRLVDLEAQRLEDAPFREAL